MKKRLIFEFKEKGFISSCQAEIEFNGLREMYFGEENETI